MLKKLELSEQNSKIDCFNNNRLTENNTKFQLKLRILNFIAPMRRAAFTVDPIEFGHQ